MEPSMKEGDYVIVSRLHGGFRSGDIVVLMHPLAGIYIIKRIKEVLHGSVFLLGDNTAASDDSRSFGTVKTSKILGKVIYKV